MTIKQERLLAATPEKIYGALTDGTKFSALTGGAPAQIDAQTFSCFGGMIHGRHVELVENERIVQAWRAKTWEPGLYSIVRFTLEPHGKKTRVMLEHRGYPEDQREHLEIGWEANYWAGLEKL
jgi:activator of HSP90 ATPase